MRSSLLAAVLAGGVLAGGCGDSESAAGAGVRVTATTALVADLVQQVGGSRVQVGSLIAAGADPHDYEPRPRDLAELARAALVVRSGGDLDEWLGEAIRSAGGSSEVLDLSGEVRQIPDDPHWWHDPRNVLAAVGALERRLGEVDPDGRAAYAAASEAFRARVRKLDAAIERCVATIPDERRKLVTSHDALGYFARRYGFEVIGTVIPARSTRAQASAGETARLVRAVRGAGVPAIFAESSVSPKVAAAVAREAGARMGPPLYADGLGRPSSPGGTYLGAMRSNALAIAGALGARACRLGA